MIRIGHGLMFMPLVKTGPLIIGGVGSALPHWVLLPILMVMSPYMP